MRGDLQQLQSILRCDAAILRRPRNTDYGWCGPFLRTPAMVSCCKVQTTASPPRVPFGPRLVATRNVPFYGVVLYDGVFVRLIFAPPCRILPPFDYPLRRWNRPPPRGFHMILNAPPASISHRNRRWSMCLLQMFASRTVWR